MAQKLGVFIWTTGRDYGQGRIPDDDTLGAMSVALFKVNDGLEYQNYTPADTKILADGIFRPQGIDFMPWGVARGWYADWAYAEGRLAGEHAAAAGRPYILDLEPYPDKYWQGIPGTAAAFCRGYAETSQGQNLRICPDARNSGINLEEWVAEPVVDVWHPQIYSRAYGESLDLWLGKGSAPLERLGVPRSKIYPVLATWRQAEGDPSISADALEEDLRRLAYDGYPGAALWRRGTMSQEQVDRLLSIDPIFAPPAPPEPSLRERALAAVDKALAYNESTRVALIAAREAVAATGGK